MATPYIVLREEETFTADGKAVRHWDQVWEGDARSTKEAIRLATEMPGRYKAVPKRSWDHTVEVQHKQVILFNEVGAPEPAREPAPVHA